MTTRRIAATVVFLLGTGSWASAQTLALPPTTAIAIEAKEAVDEPRGRPGLLVPLYLMQFTLHGLDVHSTVRGLEAGHGEANPLFKDASAKTMIGAKLAASAISVVAAEKLWKKNRTAAVLMMVGVNVGLSAVVANNYRIAGMPRR